MTDGWKQVWADIVGSVRGAPRPDPAETAPSQPALPGRARWATAAALGVVVLALAGGILWPRIELLFAPAPPAPEVVATFRGGQITAEQVRAHLALLVPKEYQDRVRTPDSLRALVEEMVEDEWIRRWAAERKADTDEKFRHTMQHISEELDLDSRHAQLHKSDIPVPESQIQAYYRANQAELGGKPLDQVRGEIRDRIVREAEPGYVNAYLERLKANASLAQDLSLLETPEPSEDELRRHYDANRAQFKLPAQAVVDEIQIPIDGGEPAARERAEAARRKLQSGMSFAEAAQAIPGSRVLTAASVVSGTRGAEWTSALAGLQPGGLSDVLRDGGLLSVVRLRARQPERVAGLAEVRARVLAAVREQKADEWFNANRDRTLITLKGQRYSLGQFYREYQELPAEVRARYAGAEGRKQLAQRLIERLLMVEDSADRLLDVKNKAELDETRLDVLRQMFHQEGVDDKVKIGDDEVKADFERNSARLVRPPKARIRYVRIGLGQTPDEEKRALEKAGEAHRRLVPGWFRQGAEFAAIAREYSEDQDTAAKGGELDAWIGEGSNTLAELAEHPFHEQVLALKAGGVSAPFIYGDSVYIVQVSQRSEPQPLTLDEAAPFIKEQLRRRRHDEALAKLSDQLKEQAGATIYDTTLRALLAAMQPQP